jgi:hypothetical protein
VRCRAQQLLDVAFVRRSVAGRLGRGRTRVAGAYIQRDLKAPKSVSMDEQDERTIASQRENSVGF